MNQAKEEKRGFPGAAAAGASYLAVGIGFAELARMVPSSEMRLFWRLGAWAASFAILAAHLVFETRRHPPRRAAFHAAVGVALGAFGLAAWINLHAPARSGRRNVLVPLALVVFPVVTGIPAFLGAWAAAAVLARRRRDRAA